MAGKFKIEWYGKEVIEYISNITEKEEAEAALRIRKSAKRKVPVGKVVRRGKGPTQSRYPGRLKRTIKRYRSKFRDGGWIVWAGSKWAYYAAWVEFGTIFTHKRGGERYMRDAIRLEKSRFTRRLKKALS